jgi:16S rRNA (cytosine1402-N4)-methyltransferase
MPTKSIDKTLPCETLVNTFPEPLLEEIIRKYGEERNSRKIARKICEHREKHYISSGVQLAALIADISGPRHVHAATRTFQAFRIYINDEMNQLFLGLKAAERILKPDGLLMVVSFHSLEDRLVKSYIRGCAGLRPEIFSTDEDLSPSFRLLKNAPSILYF